MSLWGARLTVAAADTLSALALSEIGLGSAPRVDDDVLGPLARRPGLRRLAVSSARRVTGAFLANLPERPEAGIEHRMSVRRAELPLPKSLPRPLAEGQRAVVPEWLEPYDDVGEEPPPRIVPTGWS